MSNHVQHHKFEFTNSTVFNMASPYKLRCNLVGHEKDVRALVTSIFPENGLISGSRDNTSCIWVENE